MIAAGTMPQRQPARRDTGPRILIPGCPDWHVFKKNLLKNLSFDEWGDDVVLARYYDNCFFSRALLVRLGYDHSKTLEFFGKYGGYCDEDIFFNVDRLYKKDLRGNNNKRKILFIDCVGLGDSVVLTGVLRMIKKTCPGISIAVQSFCWHAFFDALPYLSRLSENDDGVEVYKAWLSTGCRNTALTPMPPERMTYPQLVHLGIMSKINMSWDISAPLPDLRIPEGTNNPAHGIGRYWVISGNHSIAFKFWPGYGEVIRSLAGRVRFVQVGLDRDRPFDGAIDLRGKTSLLELSAVIRGAAGVLGGPGFSVHIAAAFNIPHVTIAGAVEHSGLIGYPGHVVINKKPQEIEGCKNYNWSNETTCSGIAKGGCTNKINGIAACMCAITPAEVVEVVLRVDGNEQRNPKEMNYGNR